MKIAYITKQTPYGEEEQFILSEIISSLKTGNEILVLPLDPNKELFEGSDTKIISQYTLSIPLHSKEVILLSIILFLKSPIRCFKQLCKIIINSGSLKKLNRNLSVFGKGITLSEVFKRNNIDHIHAYWADTTSTAVYIAAMLSEIPWSFTCHSSEVEENNMLREKINTSKFVRVMNQKGYNKLVTIVGEIANTKCRILDYNGEELIELMK